MKMNSRSDDDKLLDMLVMRQEGYVSQDVANRHGTTNAYVRAATNRVVKADAAHHAEPIKFPTTQNWKNT